MEPVSQRFDAFMADALYGPDGFYTTGRGVAGRRHGDFITSPEVGPLFGELVARWISGTWERIGRPQSFPVYDIGTGPGTLLKSLRNAAPPCAASWSLVGVDLATESALPEDLTDAVVVGNELLDNVPFRWLRSGNGTTEEAFVDGGGLAWSATGAGPAGVVGHYPLVEGAQTLMNQILGRNPAAVLMFDYGSETTAELAARGDWLRCYRNHQRGTDPLSEPGHWDITTDVPLDQLPAARRRWTQAEFCEEHGIDDLVEEGRAYWRAYASRPDLKTFRMRSRISEAEALTDPNGLGAFWVAEWRPQAQ